MSGAFVERMMGLEPTTFCMATGPYGQALLRYARCLSHFRRFCVAVRLARKAAICERLRRVWAPVPKAFSASLTFCSCDRRSCPSPPRPSRNELLPPFSRRVTAPGRFAPICDLSLTIERRVFVVGLGTTMNLPAVRQYFRLARGADSRHIARANPALRRALSARARSRSRRSSRLSAVISFAHVA